MDKLDKAYEAVSTLEALDLPVGKELLNSISEMEKEFLQNEIIPFVKQELEPKLKKMRNQFTMNVVYTREKELKISLSNPLENKLNIPSVDEDSYRKKKYIIRVTFPDNHVVCHKIVSKTMIEVIQFAGAKNVERLGFKIFGVNIISSSLLENERYQGYQHEVEPGIYVCTYCNTDRKLDILNRINRELSLGLVIEKVSI